MIVVLIQIQSKKMRHDLGPPVYLTALLCDGSMCGLVLDGAYVATKFVSGKLSSTEYAYLLPFDETPDLRLPCISGKLLKATDIANILNDKSNGSGNPLEELTKEDLKLLESLIPFMISKSGKKPGSTKLWLFSGLPLMDKSSFDDSVSFEEDVYNVILNFFKSTKRTLDPDNDNKMYIPTDISEAKKVFAESSPWNLQLATYNLDTDEKIAAFGKLVSRI